MRDLFFRIRAVDQTAAAFARVRSGLKGLDGAFAGLNDRAARASSRLRSIGESLSAQTAQIRDAFSGSMAAYDASAQSAAKVEAAIRSTGGAAGYAADQLAEMAAGFQRTTRFDGDDILGDVTAQLLTFTRIAGEPFARAQAAVLDMSTLLGSDLKSSAILVGKALNDPVRGLTAMGRAGIQFSEGQKETIRHLAETGQIAKAQGLILDELAVQLGGQAVASARTGLGALDQLGNAWGDIQETVGESLATFAVPLAGVLQTLADGFSGLPVPVQKFGVALGLIALAAGPVIVGLGLLVGGIAAIGLPAAAAIAGVAALTAGLVAFWPQITAGIGWLAETVRGFSALELAFAPVALAAHALGDVFAAVFPETSALVDKTVEEITGWLTGKLGAAFDWVVGKVGAVGDAFYNLYDRVVGHSYVPDMIDGISAEMARLKSEMVDPVTDATAKTGAKFQDLASGVGAAIGDLVREGDFTFRGFTSRMVDLAGQMADSIVSDSFARVAQAAQGLGSGSGSSGGGFMSAVGSFVSGLFGGGSSAAIPGFAGGGSFEVGGRGGVDRNLAVMRVSRGERVSIDRRGDTRSGGPVVVNISTPNPAAFDRSRGQVAATISRAVARGARNL